ncbi:MAG: tetratricopeptide repeat protein [Planctomycetota bacterium]|jgi:hypothetical protein
MEFQIGEKMQKTLKKNEIIEKTRTFCIFAAVVLVCFSPLPGAAFGQDTSDSGTLFSPSVSEKFYEIGYELALQEPKGQRFNQASIFLTTALELGGPVGSVYPVLVDLAYKDFENDYSQLIYDLLKRYIKESKVDLDVAESAVQYLLERQNSREQREQILGVLLTEIGEKNSTLDSRLNTILALLALEKTDIATAGPGLLHAYSSNKYNRLAFAKLVQIMPEQISEAMYLEHLRLTLAENPLDLGAGLAFADFSLKLGLYQTAGRAYEYCADLFSYLNPEEQLPEQIYLPWAISSYNSPRNQHKAIQIAADLRDGGGFDLYLEAVAAKAALKIGDREQFEQILAATEKKALELLEQKQLGYKSLAWFYCLGAGDAIRALDTANKAYSSEPNSALAASILTYALVMNGQNELADQIMESYEPTQISQVAHAQILFEKGQKDSAIEKLKSAIEIEPSSLVAGQAKTMLKRNGSEYISSADSGVVLASLKALFGEEPAPVFRRPEKRISFALNFQGNELAYGSDFVAAMAITNNSSGPLCISDEGLFSGNIRVAAQITGGINKTITNLVSKKVDPGEPIKPGQGLFIPLQPVVGQLREILIKHPQASFEIEFTAYIDPVVAEDGSIINRFATIPPNKVTVTRPGIKLTDRFLRNRINSLSKGRQGQKVKTSELFVGLLMEQNTLANHSAPYEFMYADWMPEMLKSALVHNLKDEDWVVRAHTMAQMTDLRVDFELINAVSPGLNDAHWPNRMLALWLLAQNGDANFQKVLDWSAKYDADAHVRNFAVALGGKLPQQEN